MGNNKELQKIWYQKNKQRISEDRKNYYKNNPDKKLKNLETKRKWLLKNKKHVSDYAKRYAENNRHIINRNIAKTQQKYPEKVRARRTLNNAIRDNRLTRGVCSVCGNPKVEGHHEDYSKPLEVIWFCRKHHIEYHKNQCNG